MIKSTYWLLRNLKLFYLPPVIVLIIYMPFISYALYRTYYASLNIFFSEIYNQFQLFIPLFAVWWTIFVLKEFMESDGNELLYIYNKPWRILKIQLIIFALYSIHIIVFMLGFNLFFGGYYFATIQLIISSFTMCAFAYFISFAVNSTGIAFLFSIAYALSLNLFDLDNKCAIISIFPTTEEITSSNIAHLLAVFVVGIVLFVAGYFVSRIRKSYR